MIKLFRKYEGTLAEIAERISTEDLHSENTRVTIKVLDKNILKSFIDEQFDFEQMFLKKEYERLIDMVYSEISSNMEITMPQVKSAIKYAYSTLYFELKIESQFAKYSENITYEISRVVPGSDVSFAKTLIAFLGMGKDCGKNETIDGIRNATSRRQVYDIAINSLRP